MSIFTKSRLLITGAAGFLGRKLAERLTNVDGSSIFLSPDRFTRDLTDPRAVESLFIEGNFDLVFHLAGHNGGINFNLMNKSDIFTQNTIMGLNILDACRRHRVKKVVSVVASCAYPMTETNLSEEWFLEDEPHISVACHGYSKRNLQLASSYCREQYGLNAVCVCPTTLYGPGDSFDPKRTKVMGGMVKRFVDASNNKDETVTCWGSGRPMREFLYVEDAAELIVQAMDHYEDCDIPLNLGSGHELSVKDLATLVAECADYRGKILWDETKPDGQWRKRLCLTRMREILPGVELTNLRDGILATVDYYRSLR